MKEVILVIYFLILLFIGAMASGKIKDFKDYYVGGKKLGYWVVAFSTRATGESAWLLLGLTGLGALVGVSAFWVVLGEVLGVTFSWLFMAKRFKVLTDKYQSITIPDFLSSHFGTTTNTLRIIAATALSVFVIIYVSAQIDATGSAFEVFMGWNYYYGILAGFLIVVVYIFFGGFVAVVWSDVFQGALMLLGLVLLPIIAWSSLSTPNTFINDLKIIDPDLLNVWGAGGLSLYNIATILGYMAIGIGFMGSPQLFVRFISVKSPAEIDKGRWVAIVFTLLTDSAAVLIGIFGRYLFTEAGSDPFFIFGNGAQNVLPMMVDNLLPLTLAGVYVAVVLSAIMSTVDSLLVVASSAVVRDFYQQILRPDKKDQNLTQLSRIVTLVMALAALCIAMTVAMLSPDRTIFWFVIFGWSGIAATFCPVIMLSLFWKDFTERGAIAAMITGFISVPLFEFVMPRIPIVGIYFEQLAEMLPSFLLALLAGYIVSKIWPKVI